MGVAVLPRDPKSGPHETNRRRILGLDPLGLGRRLAQLTCFCSPAPRSRRAAPAA